MRLVVIFTLLFFLFTPMAFAEVTANELLRSPDLNQTERDALAKAIRNLEAGKIPASAGEMKKWQELGDAFAITIKSVAHTLNIEVNAFLQSDVGKLTAVVIVYKMIGKDILRIIIYGGAGVMVSLIIFSSLWIFHKGKKFVNKDGTISYIERFEWANEDIKTASLIVHLIVWLLFIGILTGTVI